MKEILIKDVSGKVYWDIQKAFGKPVSAMQITAMLNAAIENGIVQRPEAKKEMLEALEDALATCEHDMQHILDNGRLRSVLRAAISKAKGEEDAKR